MKINLCFELHHPLKLKEIGKPEEINPRKLKSFIFDHSSNRKAFDELRDKSYIPTLEILNEAVSTSKSQKKQFKISMNVSGVFLDYCKKDSEIMGLLEDLAFSGRVEFLGSTYYHSLAGLMDSGEFKRQAKLHSKTIKKLFKQEPLTFANTELLYTDSISKDLTDLGFETIITEGDEGFLNNLNPNFLYADENGLKILLRHRRLTDDLALRFSSVEWDEWPLTSEKYSHWLSNCAGECATLYFDMRNFGHYHREDSGIFWFLKAFPWKVFEHNNLEFSRPKDIAKDLHAIGQLKLPENQTLSWCGLSPVNDIQKKYLNELKDLGLIISETNNIGFTNVWRLLQMGGIYRSEYGLSNISNILEYLRRHISKGRIIEGTKIEQAQPLVSEESLFPMDFFNDYINEKTAKLESVSDSVKERASE